MKLIHKFILVYLSISLVVFGLGSIISFYTFSKVNDEETDRELWGQAHQLSKLIENDIPLKALNEDGEISITILNDTVGIRKSISFSDTMTYHYSSKGIIPHRKIRSIKKINNKWHQIEIHNSLLEPGDTLYGVFVSTSLVYLLLVLSSLVLSFLISRWILTPFNMSLTKLEGFRIQNEKPIDFPKTGTREFDKFNQLVQVMTKKAIADYHNLREFSENIAHEIRTPLAIASGKLDLLMQLKNLQPKEIQLISDAQQSIKKISKIQQSLGILSRIENEEFNKEIPVNITKIVHTVIDDHVDITDMKNIQLTTEIATDVTKINDPVLIDIMVTNLFQNAIKHNVATDGHIRVKLNELEFSIENSGKELVQPTHELLGRFKKSGNGSDSIGLGLAIVKDICEKSNYQLDYTYHSENSHHKISVIF